MRHFAVALLIALFVSVPALAETVKSLGTFGGWQAYIYREKLQDVCFMELTPLKTFMKNGKKTADPRGEISLTVSYRPTEKQTPILTFNSGYVFKKSSETKVTIGKACFNLFTDKGSAWARTSSLDKEIVEAMEKGKTLIVEGYSDKGGHSVDLFDLRGMVKGMKAIKEACGLH